MVMMASPRHSPETIKKNKSLIIVSRKCTWKSLPRTRHKRAGMRKVSKKSQQCLQQTNQGQRKMMEGKPKAEMQAYDLKGPTINMPESKWGGNTEHNNHDTRVNRVRNSQMPDVQEQLFRSIYIEMNFDLTFKQPVNFSLQTPAPALTQKDRLPQEQWMENLFLISFQWGCQQSALKAFLSRHHSSVIVTRHRIWLRYVSKKVGSQWRDDCKQARHTIPSSVTCLVTETLGLKQTKKRFLSDFSKLSQLNRHQRNNESSVLSWYVYIYIYVYKYHQL